MIYFSTNTDAFDCEPKRERERAPVVALRENVCVGDQSKERLAVKRSSGSKYTA